MGTGLLYFFGFSKNFKQDKGVHALFISTSAVCVTGLSTVDTENDMTTQGHIILIFLIQFGGIGVLTLSNWLLLSIKGRLNSAQSQSTASSFGTITKLPMGKLLKQIIIFTFIVEFIGALILFFRFILVFPFSKALWYAVFHSVSAFCNAGFSLFSDNLVGYKGDLTVNLVIMFLIVAGGIGFIVVSDVYETLKSRWRGRVVSLTLHTKIVFYTTGFLILGGFVFFMVLEWNNILQKESPVTKILESMFMSVTPRTAGFNTIDVGQLTNISIIVTMLLMVIGGSPGSTAGGIKTTSGAIFWALISSNLRNRDNVELFNRTIPYPTIAKALTIITLYFLTAFACTTLIEAYELLSVSAINSRRLFIEHLFEVISAMSTVGLSMGITSKLSDFGKIIIILCMFFGRVGPLALATSLIGERKKLTYTLPKEDIIVG